MKVLIISDAWHPQINGVVRTYENLVRELEKNGHNALVIGPAHFSATMPTPFYPEIRLVIKPFRQLEQMINEFSPDRIHLATEGPLGWAGRKYCLRNKKQYTSSYHTQFPDYIAKRFAWMIPPLYNAVHKQAIKLIRTFHEKSEKLMIATPSLEQQLKEWHFNVPMTRLSRGVDLTQFYPGQKNVLDDKKRPIALYVGRIAIEKNLEDFLKMDWIGSKVLVGDGPVRKKLSSLYPDAYFVGKKQGKELADYYRSADVFVFPSKTDTFGIVIIEALASGLPVAAYNVMGPRDIITKNFLGALDDHSLSKAAYKAIKQAIPEKCVEFIGQNYTWETACKQFLSAL